jgi:hypothetical protein
MAKTKVKVKHKTKGKEKEVVAEGDDDDEYETLEVDDEGEGQEDEDDDGEEGEDGEEGDDEDSHDPALDGGSGSDEGGEDSEGGGSGKKKRVKGRVPTRKTAKKVSQEETDAAYYLTVNAEKIRKAEEEGGVVGDDEMPDLDGLEAAGDMRRRRDRNKHTGEELAEHAKYSVQWSEDIGKIVTAHETNHYLGVSERTHLLPYGFITDELMADLPNMSVVAVHRLAEMVRGHEKVMDKTDEVIGGGIAAEFGMNMVAHGIEYGAGKDGMALADMEGYAEMMKLRLKTPSAQRMMMRLYRTYWQPLVHRLTGGKEGVVSDLMQLGMLFFRGFEDHQVAKRMEASGPAKQKVIAPAPAAQAAAVRPIFAAPNANAPQITGAEQMQQMVAAPYTAPAPNIVEGPPGMTPPSEQLRSAAAQAAMATAVGGGLVEVSDPARLAQWRQEVQLDFSNKRE